MSTNSTIAIEKENGKVEVIYCHWDGYLSNNGKLLLENYNSAEKAQSLIDLGDLSNLDKSIECPEGHTFDSSVKGYSVFYGRDRREDGTEKRLCDSFDNAPKEEYNYLFKDGKWQVDGKVLTLDMCVD